MPCSNCKDRYDNILERAQVFKAIQREFKKKFHNFEICDSIEEAFVDWNLAKSNGLINRDEARITWIEQAARRKLLKVLRRLTHEQPLCYLEAKSDEDLASLSRVDAEDTSIERFEATDVLTVILRELPKHYSSVLQMYYCENLTVEDIAKVMGRSEKAIYHLKEHAVKLAKAFREREQSSLPPPPQNQFVMLRGLFEEKFKIMEGNSGVDVALYFRLSSIHF